MGQLPDLPVIVVEDLVLAVVLNHVLRDQLVIDHRRTHCLLILLNLLLGFELLLDVRFHRLMCEHLCHLALLI